MCVVSSYCTVFALTELTWTDPVKNEWRICDCERCWGVAVCIIISNLKELKNITVAAGGLKVWVSYIALQFTYGVVESRSHGI